MKKRKPSGWLWIAALLVLSAAGAAAYQIAAARAAQSAAANRSPSYQTAAVTRGSIALSASGTGTAVAVQTANLTFLNNGIIAELTVEVGDTVSAGQTIAVLKNLPALRQAAANSQLALQNAQKNLSDLTDGAAAALAQALASQSAAQAALVSAQNNLHDPHDWRCPDAVTARYYQQYLDAMVAARPWQDLLDKADDVQKQYYLTNLNPILKKMEQAYQSYQYCQAYTPTEIANSRAALELAQANAESARQVYQTLQAHSGLDPETLAIAEAALVSAQAQAAKAQADLDAATLKAPFAGVVTALNAEVGQTGGQNGVVSLASSATPQVLANLDETDLANIAAGCKALVTFNARPALAYPGTVERVYPALAAVRGASAAQALITLDAAAAAKAPVALGSDAVVEVICAQAQNVWVITLPALHENSDGSAYVYLLNGQGQPEKRTVEIGIRTSASVEIRTGLKAGDQVILSDIQLP